MLVKNLLANFAGRIWSIFSIYLFVPIYVRLLGVEGYGIISFYLTLSGLLLLADLGMSAGISREMARNTNTSKEKIEIIRSMELLFFLMAIFILIVMTFSSDLIARNWLRSANILQDKLTEYVFLIGIAGATQLLSSCYFSGLLGLEKQVLANSVQFIWSLLRSVGAVLLLYFVDAQVEMFLYAQIISNIIYVIACRVLLYKKLGPTELPYSIRLDLIKQVMIFSSGLFIITIISFVNLQSDKVFISYFLNLESLGIYNIAFMVAQAPLVLSTPISTAIFPRYNSIITSKETSKIGRMYYLSFIIIFLVVIPVSIGISFFSYDLVKFWTTMEIAEETGHLISILILGSMSIAFQVPSFNLVLAHGDTSINIRFGTIVAMASVIAYALAVKYFGLIGAAWCWFTVNLIAGPLFIVLVNMKYAKGASKAIFITMFVMTAISLSVFTIMKYFLSNVSVAFVIIPSIVFGVLLTVYLFIRFYLKTTIRSLFNEISLQ